MIRIVKPDSPEILLNKGQTERDALCQAYEENPRAYDTGEMKFTVESGIYGHPTVKDALKKAQHDKCCFCESKITHISYGDVEHFRPKNGYKNSPKDDLGRPGYYWLAYEWSNLFFSCSICNGRKGNLFPLKNPEKRVRNHHDNLAQEEPVFINPGEEDPATFISFYKEVPRAIDDDPRGRITIELLGLDRQELNDSRRELLRKLKVSYTLLRLPTVQAKNKADAKIVIEKAVLDSAEYAAMARAAIKCGFKFTI